MSKSSFVSGLIFACGILSGACTSVNHTASRAAAAGVSVDNGGEGVQREIASIELHHTGNTTVEKAVLKAPDATTVEVIDCTLSRASDGGDAGNYGCRSKHFSMNLFYNNTTQVPPSGKLKSIDGATYDVTCQYEREGDVPNSTLDYGCGAINTVAKADVGAIEIRSNPGGAAELATIFGSDLKILAVIPCTLARATDGGDAGNYSCSGSSFKMNLFYNNSANIAPNGTLTGGTSSYAVSCAFAVEGDVANSTLEYTCTASKS